MAISKTLSTVLVMYVFIGQSLGCAWRLCNGLWGGSVDQGGLGEEGSLPFGGMLESPWG